MKEEMFLPIISFLEPTQQLHGRIVDEYNIALVIAQKKAVGGDPDGAEEPGVIDFEEFPLGYVIEVEDQPLKGGIVHLVRDIPFKVYPGPTLVLEPEFGEYKRRSVRVEHHA